MQKLHGNVYVRERERERGRKFVQTHAARRSGRGGEEKNSQISNSESNNRMSLITDTTE
jgi:hypothetical protein